MSPDSATPSALETKRRLPQLRAWDGALTEQLVRQPGRYGLGQVPSQLAPDATTGMICGFCATGCGLNLHLKDGEAVNLSPDTDYPVNLGMACPNGWEALTPLEAEDRATRPLCRTSRDAELLPVGWDQAADSFCQRMKAVQAQHGSDSVAFLGTGQICSEEMAFLGAFAKFGMGVLHGDGNTRQCMATSVRSYKESFGFDAPPYTYADFEESDVIVLIGSNLCIAHPILWQRVLRNRRNAEIIVIDPRRTETAMAGSRHVPLAPKSDLQLYYGLAHLLIRDGRVDRDYIAAHTEDYEAFAKHVEAFDLERTSRATGLPREELESLARTLGDPDKRVSYWWTMGVNQGYEAVRTAQSIINLALMTGNIGRPGTGANSITGQCNAMGSRLFSNTTCLPGGRRFESAEDRQFVAETFGIPEARIPRQESWAYDQIVQGIHDGKIKALWVVATNGSHSWIQQDGFN